MEKFLFVQQKMKSWYANYEIYLLPALKFILMMVVLLLLNWHLGYRYVLMRWVLVILVSLISALLPWSGITALAALYLMGHVSALSWEGALVMGAMLFVAMVLHYLLLPGGSILIVLVPLAFYLRIPYIIPLLAGLFGSALTFVPVGAGVLIYYTMFCLERNAAFLLDPGSNILQCFMQILDGLRTNQIMMISLVAFCLVTLAVNGLSRLSVDYARLIAVAAGAIMTMLIFLLGGFILDASISYAGVLGGCVLCGLLAAVATLCLGVPDYSRPEFLQYEDDEYIYYVKAIPKLTLSQPERKVQEINSHKAPRS